MMLCSTIFDHRVSYFRWRNRISSTKTSQSIHNILIWRAWNCREFPLLFVFLFFTYFRNRNINDDETVESYHTLFETKGHYCASSIIPISFHSVVQVFSPHFRRPDREYLAEYLVPCTKENVCVRFHTAEQKQK